MDFNDGATSYLNSLLQTVPFSPEFRSKYVFCLFCCATCQTGYECIQLILKRKESGNTGEILETDKDRVISIHTQ